MLWADVSPSQLIAVAVQAPLPRESGRPVQWAGRLVFFLSVSKRGANGYNDATETLRKAPFVLLPTCQDHPKCF